MKIIPSIRLYILLAMLITGISTILILSILSLHYFISGMDSSMRVAMYAQGQQQVTDGKPYQFEVFTVASRWQDLPESVKQIMVEPPNELNVLNKKIVGGNFITPPDAGYFVMKMKVGDEIRFVSTVFDRNSHSMFKGDGPPYFLVIVLTGLLGILAFAVVLILVMRRVTVPVERLKNWAKGLNTQQLEQPMPDFHYSELNILGNIIKTSLRSVQDSLAREQQFLSYASHELRTPIAVIRTNTELLQKLISKGASAEKQAQVVHRIERAGLTMTDLTETLLWLTRHEDQSLPMEEVNLGQLIRQLVQELSYLTKGKDIELSIETDDSIHQLPITLCRIVLNNLIRNALQHTIEGRVIIKQSTTSVSMINESDSGHHHSEELGFGLGLELTTRLINHYDWDYQNIETNSGRKVTINFSR
ncbi:HAMP domain-containing sensor histidine kinase [Shewanella sp. H8]|uniref:sensor histidine kinase n=1 Tax=Shewanella sp. H8 TaxID=3342676 RepID=UPI0033152372